jgi:hypothetical protein
MVTKKIKKPKIKKLIRDLLPKENIFSEEEGRMYDDYVDAYLADFDEDELISSDMDDIMNLAMNKILSYRLLQESRTDVDRQIDVAATLEKIDKRNEKLKESLSTRRRDRIDPNELKGFSIVDLAVAYDQDVKRKQLERLEKLRKEEKAMLKKRSDYTGNRYDSEKESDKKE